MWHLQKLTAGLFIINKPIRVYTNSIDAFTIDSNQILYGNGGGLTNLTYNNINGKPTNFQADWTSTIINKPTNFQADWTSTIINKPTNFQSDWNSTIINKPDLTPYTTSNFVLSNYTTTAGLNTLLSTKQATLTASTNILGIGSSITALNYGNISNPPNLSSYATTATLGSYSTTTQMNSSISTALTPYSTTTQMNSSISTALTPYLTSATASTTYGTITNLNLKENALTFSSPLIRTTNTISLNQSLIDYNNLINKPTLNFLPFTAGVLTGQLTLSTVSGNNPIYITSTSTTANNCIQIKNNSTYNAFVGIGGTSLGGNYANNFLLKVLHQV